MPLYAVHNYSLIVVNTSSGAVVMQQDITAANETAYTELFNSEHLVQDCLEFQITVSAANAIGWSALGTTTAGFPVCKFQHTQFPSYSERCGGMVKSHSPLLITDKQLRVICVTTCTCTYRHIFVIM